MKEKCTYWKNIKLLENQHVVVIGTTSYDSKTGDR